MIESAFPIIQTPDLPRLRAFYEGVLGAEVAYQFPANGEPGYVTLHMGTSRVGIAAEPAARAGDVGRILLWFYVDDCDAVTERVRSAGLQVIDDPADQAWGERVARVVDPDGNVLVIGTRAGGAS